jgi:hypothetical protein
MSSLTAPGARAGLAGHSPETRRSTPNPQTFTNMLSFLRVFVFGLEGGCATPGAPFVLAQREQTYL